MNGGLEGLRLPISGACDSDKGAAFNGDSMFHETSNLCVGDKNGPRLGGCWNGTLGGEGDLNCALELVTFGGWPTLVGGGGRRKQGQRLPMACRFGSSPSQIATDIHNFVFR